MEERGPDERPLDILLRSLRRAGRGGRRALDVLLGEGDADPGVIRERLQHATTVALRPWT